MSVPINIMFITAMKGNFTSILLYLTILIALALLPACIQKEEASNSFVTPELKGILLIKKIKTNQLIVTLDLDVADGWHIYGPDPQKNGRPLKIEFSSKNLISTVKQWPDTKTFSEGQAGSSFGYDGNFQVSANLNFSEEGNYLLQSDISWVACRQICVPGEAKLSAKISEAIDLN